ncbi:Y-family DNA polymerase [Hydrogenophaga defluvii]|uniref:Y-family DNA polymerase n=1 Tax=Hydrogenophaga defluvii TaxID=249410 RepID=A0ABW2SEX2_9BURK
MGQPWFQIEHLVHSHGLVGLSANFTLYGDMSSRLMSLIAGYGHRTEVYSIDEAFCDLSGIPGDMTQRGFKIRARIERWLGLQCGIGIGATKTIAKLANHVSKDAERKPGSYPPELAQVCNLAALSPPDLQEIMRATAVGDVWGVGRRIGEQLTKLGVATALDLAQMDAGAVRRRWSVVLERTVLELQGTPCIALEDAPGAKKQIAVTRSFGNPVESLDGLLGAVSDFAARAGEKLRKQGSFAGQLHVFAHTSPFRPPPHFSRSVVVPLRKPTADSRSLVEAACAGIRFIFEPGHQIQKAGVILLDLAPSSLHQGELELEESDSSDKSILMTTVDSLNRKYGRGAVSVGGAGFGPKKEWAPRQMRLTPHYTTRLEDIPVARA